MIYGRLQTLWIAQSAMRSLQKTIKNGEAHHEH